MTERPAKTTLLALGIVTACTLGQQIVITRLFSAVLAYHFGFLAISIALFGTGAGALLLYLKPERFEGALPNLLARWSVVFAIGLVVAPVVLVRLSFEGDAASVGFGINLAAACALAAWPAFASGVVVALALERFPKAFGPVYAADLVGAGLGAFLIVPVLFLGSAPDLMIALGVIVALAAMLFALEHPPSRNLALGVAVAGGSVLGLARVTELTYLDPRYVVPEGTKKLGEHWTPLARHFGFKQPHPGAPALLFYDRVYAPVPIVRGDQLPNWSQLMTGPASVGFAAAGPGRALIIGGGGGRDIYNALSSKQWPVDVIELMDGNRRVVDEDLGALSGRPYSRAGVSTVIGDGRSVLAARDTKYDQIHIGFTDTLSANAAQGFALTENNLYTVEAFDEYFDHLRPKGILNVSRLLKLVGDEALRVTVLTLEALRRRGVDDPFQHVIVVLGADILGPPTGTVLARNEPFTPQEVDRIRRLANERAKGLLMAPGGPNQREWAALAAAPSIASFCENHSLDVCPPTDDKPFFFSMHRWRDWGQSVESGYHYSTSPAAVLLLTLAILGLLSLLGFILPLRLVRGPDRPTASSLAYFGAIGLGFLLFEIVLIQRLVMFLGYPTYALSVVLFALLISSGLGALYSSRLEGRRSLSVVLAIATGLIVASAFGLPTLLRSFIGLGLAARIAIAVALIAPTGACLGMAMPLGLRRLRALHPKGVAYAWGVNGIASVLASVLGMVVAINFGFVVATLVAGACYAAALAHAALGRWPDASTS